MRNIFLIARREYLERIRTKSFLVMTLLIPLMMAGLTIGPGVLISRISHRAKHMVVVASNRATAETIREQLLQAGQQSRKSAEEAGKLSLRRTPVVSPELTVDVDTDTSAEHRSALTKRVLDKKLDSVLWAPDDALAAHKIPLITRDVSSFMENDQVTQSVGQSLSRRALAAKGLSAEEIENVFRPVKLDVQDPAGKGAANPRIVFLAAFVMVLILYMSVLLYGINVMRAVLEEKTSRIMEVMLSVAEPKEMMAGKILGVGAVGLTQIGIWAAVSLANVLPGAAALGGQIKSVLSPSLLAYFAVFYLFGYALYSTLYAAIGSMVNSEQEAQQLQFIAVLPLIAAAAVMVTVAQFPNSALAFWCSMIPLTSPLIMFMRIAVQTPPLWQIALSLGLLLVTIYGMVLLCGRIYRVGVLMYGKRPTLPEIVKWIRYA